MSDRLQSARNDPSTRWAKSSTMSGSFLLIAASNRGSRSEDIKDAANDLLLALQGGRTDAHRRRVAVG